MWLVSCMRRGILTKVSAQDPKGKLNISSFHTLSHLLDCLFFTRNCMPRNCMCCYYKWCRGDRKGGGGSWFILGCSWVDRWWVLSYSCWGFFTYAFVFCFLLSSVSFVTRAWQLLCLLLYFLFSLSPVPN